jgi:hypothetical protein
MELASRLLDLVISLTGSWVVGFVDWFGASTGVWFGS